MVPFDPPGSTTSASASRGEYGSICSSNWMTSARSLDKLAIQKSTDAQKVLLFDSALVLRPDGPGNANGGICANGTCLIGHEPHSDLAHMVGFASRARLGPSCAYGVICAAFLMVANAQRVPHAPVVPYAALVLFTQKVPNALIEPFESKVLNPQMAPYAPIQTSETNGHPLRIWCHLGTPLPPQASSPRRPAITPFRHRDAPAMYLW